MPAPLLADPDPAPAWPLTPGAYLKKRRCAAGLSVGDVAAKVGTVPHREAEHVRTEWIELIEADVTPAGFSTIVALRQVFAFDIAVLEELELLRMGLVAHAPVLCRICAATLVVDLGSLLCIRCEHPHRAGPRPLVLA